MGQYHVLANLDKKEYVSPHVLGLGLKQLEHLSGDASIPQALYILLITSVARGGGDLNETKVSGKWVGDRVVVLGDYTEDSDCVSIPNFGSLYGDINAEKTEWTDISLDVREAFIALFSATYSGDGWARRTLQKLEY